jgi:fermentation-respiration switch protein FrsA (DUF1100 family)
MGATVKNILDSIRRGITVPDVPAGLRAIFNPSIQPYLASLMKYNPAEAIQNLNMPVLIVNGNTDIQVTVQQAELLHAAKPDAILAIIPGMNHILKNAPADRTANSATYQNHDLPLNAMLVQRIVSFIHSASSHNHS